MTATLLALFGALAAGGPCCVSVNLASQPSAKSGGVTYAEPGAPFARLESRRADGAWQNKKNGNTISYLSTCNDPADPPLESVARELTSSLDGPQVSRSSSEPFNGREALHFLVAGAVDGVKTEVEAIVFKRNHCIYSLSYVGVQKAFQADRARFQEFLDGFRAP
jgi:hypothetical protein